MESRKLTTKEKELIYEEMLHAHAVMDAEKHLLSVFGFAPYEQHIRCEEFEARAGFSLEEAVNPKSPFYVLNTLVDLFFNVKNADIPDNITWEGVVNGWFLGL